jgi:hypothetical protein
MNEPLYLPTLVSLTSGNGGLLTKRRLFGPQLDIRTTKARLSVGQGIYGK